METKENHSTNFSSVEEILHNMVSNLINIVSIVNYFYHVSMLKNFIDSVNRFLPQLKLGVSTKGLYDFNKKHTTKNKN